MSEYKRLTLSDNTHRPYADKCFKCVGRDCNKCDLAYEVWERLAELEDKIEQGTLIELPCIIVGNGSIDAFGEKRVPYYQVLYADKNEMLKVWKTTDGKAAENRLKELQG